MQEIISVPFSIRAGILQTPFTASTQGALWPAVPTTAQESTLLPSSWEEASKPPLPLLELLAFSMHCLCWWELVQVWEPWVWEQQGQCASRPGVRQGLGNVACLLALDRVEALDAQEDAEGTWSRAV